MRTVTVINIVLVLAASLATGTERYSSIYDTQRPGPDRTHSPHDPLEPTDVAPPSGLARTSETEHPRRVSDVARPSRHQGALRRSPAHHASSRQTLRRAFAEQEWPHEGPADDPGEAGALGPGSALGLASQQPLVLDAQERPICVAGRVLPRLYLLGQKKCGTTSVAVDLKKAGAQHPFLNDKWRKEIHSFDNLCGWKVARAWGPEEWTGDRGPGRCPVALSAYDRERWLVENPWHVCEETTRGVFADLTPLNLRLVGLPQTLRQLYGPEADRLGFVIFLREPLSRFQSGFYSSRNSSAWARGAQSSYPPLGAFAEYVSTIREKITLYQDSDPAHLDHDYHLGHDYSVDEFYRSLYGLNLEPWLHSFQPHQFVIVPMKYYFESAANKLHTLDMIGKQFEAYLVPELAGVDVLERNAGDHPSLSTDLDEETREWLMRSHFDPDGLRLADQLAQGLPHGLAIAGYEGQGDPDSISAYLKEHW